jgi:hypothetical protein
MKNLRTVLKPYTRQIVLGEPDPATGPSLAVLRGRLEKILDDNRVYFRLCVILTVTLFVAALAIVLVKLSQPGVIQVVFAALTAVTSGAIYMMRSLWREKVATEILLALTDAFEGEALRTVVDTFIRWLR